jgi:hypothetical protein
VLASFVSALDLPCSSFLSVAKLTRPSSKRSGVSIVPDVVPAKLRTPPRTSARYDFSTVREDSCWDRSRASAGVRATSNAPVVPLSSRWMGYRGPSLGIDRSRRTSVS